MSANDLSSADPFGQIADEFVEAFRQGKRPSVEEFTRRYPEHADEIRDPPRPPPPRPRFADRGVPCAEQAGPGEELA